MSADVERVIPAPDWWNRMWESTSAAHWCDAEVPEVPKPLDRVWGCYRNSGHTGRHLGLASVGYDTASDAWVIWS